MACFAATQGEAERAAKLFGAVEAWYRAMSYNGSPADRAWRAPYLKAARSQLEEAAWAEAWARGQTIRLEDAITYALNEGVGA